VLEAIQARLGRPPDDHRNDDRRDGDRPRYRRVSTHPPHRMHGAGQVDRRRGASSLRGVAIEVVLAGRVRGKRRTGPGRHLPGGWSTTTTPINVVLVDHPDGPASSTPGRVEITAPGLRGTWLRSRDSSGRPGSVRWRSGARRDPRRPWVACTCTSTGGGVAGFPTAEVVVSRVGVAAQGTRTPAGVRPGLWPAGAAAPRRPGSEAARPFAGYDAGDASL
jgi:hypothetical protein